jgi:TPR repeat protein
VCYERGEGVRKDAGKAVEWWRKAAEQGHAQAQEVLLRLRLPEDTADEGAEGGGGGGASGGGLCGVCGGGSIRDDGGSGGGDCGDRSGSDSGGKKRGGR